jgi:hypothetical protein
MTCACIPISELLSDKYLFPVIQILLTVFAIVCWVYGQCQSGNFAKIDRSDITMATFYGIYAALSGLFVAICSQVEIAENYRVIWILTDVTLIAYICIFNPWFRNKLLGLIEYLKKIETR